MTISTSSSQITASCNGVANSFNFPFVGVSASDITVSSIASNGIITTLLPSQYTLSLNAANANQLWGVGGTVSFTIPPAAGTSLLMQRTLPLTQSTSVQNQGNYYSQVTEQALDILCMEIQQVSARTTQFRGTWTTATVYNVGDIVQDGVNGAGTNNYYICQIANTSGVWATDLSKGDWAISVIATIPTTNQPITLTGAISGSGTSSIATGINPNAVTNSSIISGGVTLSKLANIGPNSVIVNSSATSGTPSSLALSSGTLVGMDGGNVAAITLGNTLSLQANTLSVVSSNAYQNVIIAPSGTTNAASVMMGLAGAITTASTGSIMIMASGSTTNTTSSGVINLIQLRYGTGTAPSNGAALTGTAAGGRQNLNIQTNNQPIAFGVQAIVTGLSVPTAYWIDLSLASGAAGFVGSLANVSLTAYELK